MALKGHTGWIGLGVVAVVLAGIVGACAAILPLKGPDLFPSRTVSGPSWCREQTSARPFLRVVDEAAIGGKAWPERKAFTVAFELGHTTITGPNELKSDHRTIVDALAPGLTRTDDPARRIDPTTVAEVQAAAARLDRYCDSRVGPPPPTPRARPAPTAPPRAATTTTR